MTQEDKLIIEFSASTLDVYQRCERLYQYTCVDYLTPLIAPQKRDKGSLIHLILENYYKKQKDGMEKLKAYTDTLEYARVAASTATDLDVPESNEVIEVFKRYHLRYLHDNWIPVLVEEPFSKIIFENEDMIVIVKGKIDLGVLIPTSSMPDQLRIVDHKSGDKFYQPNGLNNQFEIYCMATGAREVTRNFIGWQKDPNLNFRRNPIPYNSERLEEAQNELVYWAMRMYESEVSGHFPQRKVSCWNCSFKGVCEAPPDGRKFKLQTGYKKREKFDLFKKSEDS